MSRLKLNFNGEWQGLESGIGIMSRRYGFELADEGIPVKVERSSGGIEVSMDGQTGKIRYCEKIHFFRALGLFIEALQAGTNFYIKEQPQFSMNGIMIDVSRNAVMNVASLKRTIEMMAAMGLNLLMLYAEDTYTIESQPYFGYMRGRYTQAELKECDDYADLFGVEMIPCIQTLAHLTAALKWNYARELKDTDDILLAGSEKTYAFIEEMIRAASAPFRSKRIHIGMDEAHNLGLGRYLDENGYRSRFDIMNEHLARVKEIAYQYGLKPMIWSDMYFRLASRTGQYYDPEAVIPKEVIEKVPADVQLVFWDYYHNDMESYEHYIQKHFDFGRSDIVFAGGIWTWNGLNIAYDKSFVASNAALEACKRTGIKEVFATLWGDNGAETNFFSALLGMQLYAEHGYSEELDMEKLKRRFAFCTGGNYDAFRHLAINDSIGLDSPQLMVPSNPSKFLLWQDLLIGLFDKHAEITDFPAYYAKAADQLLHNLNQAGEWRFVFEMPQQLASVLSLKSHLGLRIKHNYDKKDITGLQEIVQQAIPELRQRVSKLQAVHKRQWFQTYKPFGWEVLDMRYGGLLARIDSAAERLADYINGNVDLIEELEQERLYFDGPSREEGRAIGLCNQYHRIVSASPLGFNG